MAEEIFIMCDVIQAVPGMFFLKVATKRRLLFYTERNSKEECITELKRQCPGIEYNGR